MSPHIFLVAGEESGDRLGAALIAGIKRRAPAARFSGVGGTHMTAAGVPSLFPLGELAIIGFVGIAMNLPKILRRIRETADAVVTAKPDVLVIIDSPEFTTAWRAACAPVRRESALSTMSARRSGPGARVAPAPCGLTSTTCWRCCRSSRK